MNSKKRTVFTATLTLFVAAMFAITVIPASVSQGDPNGTEANPYEITIQVGQTYEYTPVFNIKNVSVTTKVKVGTEYTSATTDNYISDLNVTSGKISFKGGAVTTVPSMVKITGASAHISSNTADQYLAVTVVAALEIINTPSLTFYTGMAGQSKYVTSSNDGMGVGVVKYSALSSNASAGSGKLPEGLHMDAAGNGMIYGKPTTIGDYTVSVTATNTVTGITATKNITIHVVKDPSSFTLTKGSNVEEESGKYYVINNTASFSFTSDVTGGNWTVKASESFASAISHSVSVDTTDVLTFSVTDKLSGDYVVYLAHTENGCTTEAYVVIHFQAPLGYDTVPRASYYVSYSGSGMSPVPVTSP